MRCHATPRCCLTKRKNGIGRTARLEGTDLLKIFALKKQGRPARVIQPRIRQDGGAMNVWANPFMRCADRIKVD
jgi:hypothetical protein